jgi:hypothetical protein
LQAIAQLNGSFGKDGGDAGGHIGLDVGCPAHEQREEIARAPAEPLEVVIGQGQARL